MTEQEKLLAEVEAFLKRHDMPPTTMGKQFCNDWSFVDRLRRGRSPSLVNAGLLRDFMKAYKRPKRRPNRAAA